MSEGTIAAIATAFGEGGIGIIKISGEKSEAILKNIWRGASLEAPCLHKEANRKLIYGHIVDGEEVVDEVLVSFMKAPKTYTGENVAEIYTHGGVVPLRRTLDLVLRNGARLAEKGEFTKRAFLNGKLDLAQADAVIDLIKAKTEKSFANAYKIHDGALSEKINIIRTKITELLSLVIVNLDYPDVDGTDELLVNISNNLQEMAESLGALQASGASARLIRDGVRIAIAGRPNAGKSSFINIMIGENRAIVTDTPGTTRDTIEEPIEIDGLPFIFTDTAGIHETADEIEKIGIEKAISCLEAADLVVHIVDVNEALEKDALGLEKELAGQIKKTMKIDTKVLILLNKIDLIGRKNKTIIANLISASSGLYEGENMPSPILFSAKTGQGKEELQDQLINLVGLGDLKAGDSLLVTNARHLQYIGDASKEIGAAVDIIEEMGDNSLDFVQMNLQAAYESLGFIVGDSINEDILDEVFSRFCIGK